MAKDDYTCDVCGEFAPAHDPDCVFGRNGRQRVIAEEAKRKSKVPTKAVTAK